MDTEVKYILKVTSDGLKFMAIVNKPFDLNYDNSSLHI